MKNIIKTAGYSLVAVSSVAYTSAVDYGIADGKKYGNEAADGDIMTTLSSILDYLLGFLAFVATAFAIYGGFQILTAGWDEERVKKWKTTLINALIGVFVIVVAWTLVSWVLTSTSGTWSVIK